MVVISEPREIVIPRNIRVLGVDFTYTLAIRTAYKSVVERCATRLLQELGGIICLPDILLPAQAFGEAILPMEQHPGGGTMFVNLHRVVADKLRDLGHAMPETFTPTLFYDLVRHYIDGLLVREWDEPERRAYTAASELVPGADLFYGSVSAQMDLRLLTAWWKNSAVFLMAALGLKLDADKAFHSGMFPAGLDKDRPETFTQAAETFGCAVEELGVVDDNWNVLSAAITAGVKFLIGVVNPLKPVAGYEPVFELARRHGAEFILVPSFAGFTFRKAS